MQPNEYLEKSKRTDLDDYQDMLDRCSDDGRDETLKLLHACMGISTEAGELLDVMKKYLAYGRIIDRVNLAEECGDVLWYVAIILRTLGLSFEDVMQMNINKLEKRFPEKFTADKANNRNLKTEREELESSMPHYID
jgi:NTP pyrophosphatase (non-canonical NTP hydrolase)